jgi:hypothetical protein
MNGTTLHELQNNENREQMQNVMNMQKMQQMNELQYTNSQQLQRENGHNAQHATHQNQHIPYVVPHTTRVAPTMVNLAQDINNNVPSEGPQVYGEQLQYSQDINNNALSERRQLHGEQPQYSKDNLVATTDNNSSMMNRVPKRLRDPLLIIVLFIILSQPVVRDTIGKYIKQINPDQYGKIPLSGIVIYGLIFSVLFDLSKRFLLK